MGTHGSEGPDRPEQKPDPQLAVGLGVRMVLAATFAVALGVVALFGVDVDDRWVVPAVWIAVLLVVGVVGTRLVRRRPT